MATFSGQIAAFSPADITNPSDSQRRSASVTLPAQSIESCEPASNQSVMRTGPQRVRRRGVAATLQAGFSVRHWHESQRSSSRCRCPPVPVRCAPEYLTKLDLDDDTRQRSQDSRSRSPFHFHTAAPSADSRNSFASCRQFWDSLKIDVFIRLNTERRFL